MLLLLILACRAPAPADSDEVPGDTDVEDTDPADTDAPDTDEDTDCEPLPWFADADGDGWGAGAEILACEAPTGHAAAAGDCDDGASATYPGAADADCDGVDADCDGIGTQDVWLVAVNGDVTDLTDEFAAPVAYEADRNGTITFCPGTWTATIDVTGHDVTLRGEAVLDAQGAGPVVTVSSDAVVTIEGLTLTGGLAEHGGGVRIVAPYSDVRLRGATILGNTAEGSGGGVFVGGGQLGIEGGAIRENTAATGGGIAGDGAWTVTDAVIQGNTATNGGAVATGAIRPTVERSVVYANGATDEGGAFWVGSAGVILIDTLVDTNTAARGGAFYVSGLADVACLPAGGVLGNTATEGGGAWVTSTGTIYSTACDWGEAASENVPSDVHLEADDLVITDLGASESFRCDGDVGKCEPR
jgi:hypothetical protein